MANNKSGKQETFAPSHRIGDILVSLGYLQRDEADKAAVEARDLGVPIGEYISRGLSVSERDIYQALARQRGVEFGTADEWFERIHTEELKRISKAYMHHMHVLPVETTEEGSTVVTSNPQLDEDELTKALGGNSIRVVLVTPTDFTRMWVGLKLGSLRPIKREEEDVPTDVYAQQDQLEQEFIADTWLAGLFGAILLDAIAQRASDIHFEAFEDRLRIRFRIDGQLRTMTKYPVDLEDLPGLVNIVKIHADLDIAERRRPQGGRFRRKVSDTVVDLRVQTQSTLYGENMVIRLLQQTRKRFRIDELGFAPSIADEYRKLLQAPSGLVLFVGPTGSGKTTSLYAGLSILAEDETRKVITVEDPIEYTIENIMQTQVNRIIGYTFDQAMRVMVREDPDAILVGEIRDPETALEALRASQTGHLVLSTLHCNDTVDAVQRLYDLGMHANSIASEVQAIFAQRLAPKICPDCRTPDEPDAELAKLVFGGKAPQGFMAYRGKGCDRCEGLGLRGRIGVIEYLPVRAAMRGAIAQHLPIDKLRQAAFENQLVPMRDLALDLVHKGLIPFSYLPRMILPEHLAPTNPENPFQENPDARILDTGD